MRLPLSQLPWQERSWLKIQGEQKKELLEVPKPYCKPATLNPKP